MTHAGHIATAAALRNVEPRTKAMVEPRIRAQRVENAYDNFLDHYRSAMNVDVTAGEDITLDALASDVVDCCAAMIGEERSVEISEANITWRWREGYLAVVRAHVLAARNVARAEQAHTELRAALLTLSNHVETYTWLTCDPIYLERALEQLPDLARALEDAQEAWENAAS